MGVQEYAETARSTSIGIEAGLGQAPGQPSGTAVEICTGPKQLVVNQGLTAGMFKAV